ncbi:MAG: DVU0259 family response regulator domain-containing protein [Desulfohalobiaceae bacterium]
MAKKILCVDDEPAVVDYLLDIFQDNGYQTCYAHDGKQAWKVVQEERPDLITLDLDMSTEWGTRFYRRLCQHPELKRTPIVVISGLAGNKYAVKTAAAVVDKPFTPEQVLSAVRAALEE